MSERGHPSRGSAAQNLLWVVTLLSIGAVATGVWLEKSLRGRYEPALAARKQELAERVDAFCEKQALVAADPWFHEARSQGDAGPLLNAWMGWDGQGPDMPKDSPLQLPAHLRESQSLEAWFASDVDLSKLDFGWMGELQRFDRWDVLVGRPVKPAEPFNLFEDAAPKLRVLQEWTKFRLIHGLRTGRPLEAARDVRHLAWLSYRTDTLYGATFAAVLLAHERRAHALMKEPPAEWKPQSQEQDERLREVIWSSVPYSGIVTPVDVGRKARTCGSGITRCIALVEASAMNRLLQPLLEPSHPRAYAALAEELSTPCGTTLFETVARRGATLDLSHVMQEEALPTTLPGWMRKLPRWYLEKHVAGLVLVYKLHYVEELEQFAKDDSKPASAEAHP